MIPEVDTAYLIERTVDKYGTVQSTTSTSFGCMIERDTQFDYSTGNAIAIGKGIVFTSTELAFSQGKHVTIDGEEFEIRRMRKLEVYGEFHHYELIYG